MTFDILRMYGRVMTIALPGVKVETRSVGPRSSIEDSFLVSLITRLSCPYGTVYGVGIVCVRLFVCLFALL